MKIKISLNPDQSARDMMLALLDGLPDVPCGHDVGARDYYSGPTTPPTRMVSLDDEIMDVDSALGLAAAIIRAALSTRPTEH